MSRWVRIALGLACAAGGLALIVALPLAGPTDAARMASPALMAHLPPVAFGLALLGVGAWLLATGRKK